ncbi:otefin [Drosophila guanche]|uniref:Blast:Otefin n=1 Tax=Drosophila guanche TaxID=7266 RepID=A0A3B0JT31_DROGU|nr:otefin [Drosophila guanche]SPP75891.1 blast:Otefin [Drosophila guanche]
MADLDDFDTMSDADLRAKMISQGLPNIPVTNSSRKVLVKRLRASLGGQTSPAVTASPKKSNKRETLVPAAPSAAAPAAASTPVDKPDGVKPGSAATKGRRTIASTMNDNKAAERRRPEELVAKKPAGAAPTQTQRRISSSSERREVVLERPVKKPERIVEEVAVPKRTNYHENTLEVNSMIILESDEEEDEQLARAADLVELQYKAKEQPKPRSKLTTTTTNTYEHTGKSAARMAPQVYSSKAVDPPRSQAYESSAATAFNMAPSSTASRTQTSSSSYDYLSNPTGRYSSYVRSPAQSYVTAAAPALALAPATVLAYNSGHRRSPPRQPFANELSDENEADDGQYESTFARNLARQRSNRNSPYSRRTIASPDTTGYEFQARRSLRPEEVSVSVAFRRWLTSLNEAYNLKSKMFILLVVILLIGVYFVFN